MFPATVAARTLLRMGTRPQVSELQAYRRFCLRTRSAKSIIAQRIQAYGYERGLGLNIWLEAQIPMPKIPKLVPMA